MALNNFTSFQDLAASEQQAPRLVSGGVSNGNPNNIRLADRIYGLTPSSKFNSLYEQIYAMNNGGGQYMPGWSQMVQDQRHSVTDQDQDSLFDSKGEDEIPKYKKAEGLDQAMIDLQRTSNAIMDMTGFKMKEGDPLGSIKDNPIGFLASLPAGMAAAVPSGISNVYAGITHHNIFNEKEDSYDIPEKDLSNTEAFGALGTGAIDIIGLGFGGTGRVLGGIGKPLLKAGAKALGKEAPKVLDNMAEGFISQQIKHPVGGAVAQIGADVLEEGGEEFTQSLLEDMRDDNLDSGSLGRALSSGVLGGIGGGIMSAGPSIHNARQKSKINKMIQETGDEDLTAQSQTPSIYTSTKDEEFEDLKTHHGQIATPTAQSELKEESGASREKVGAGIFRTHKADASLGVHQADTGVGVIQNLYEYSNANKRLISSKFGFRDQKNGEPAVEKGETIDDGIKTLGDIFYHNTYNNVKYSSQGAAMRAFYADRKAKGKVSKHGITIGIGRDPVTKGWGSFKVHVRDFTDGRYIALNPMAYTKVGADVDGDQTGIYMDPGDLGRITQYLSEAWMHPEGNSEFDFDFAHIGNRVNTRRENLKNKVEEVKKAYGLTDDYDQMIVDALAKNDNGVSISRVLDKLTRDVNRAKYDFETNKPREGMEDLDDGYIVSSEVLGVLHDAGESEIISFVSDSIEDAHEEATQEMDDLAKDIISIVKTVEKSGTTPHVVPGDIVEALNGIISSYVKDKNPIFRQFSTFSFWNKGDKSHRENELIRVLEYVDDTSVFKAIMRAAYRIAEIGEHPITTINGMVNDLIVAETIRAYQQKRGGTSLNVKTSTDLDLLLDCFHDANNKYVNLYNKAREDLTTHGWELKENMPKKEPISKWSKAKKDDSKKVAFLKEFSRVMADINIDEWIDVSALPISYKDLSLRNYLEHVTAFDGMADNAFIALGDDGIQTFFTDLRNVYYVDKKHQSKTMKEEIESFDPSTAIQSWNEEKGEFDPKYTSYVIGITDFYQNILGIKAAIKAGLWDLREAFKTKLGKMLFSTNSDSRLSAVVALGMRTKYASIIEDLKSDNEEKQDRALLKLSGMKYNPTMAIISSQLQESFLKTKEPISPLYNMITNLDYGYERKSAEFQNWFSEHSNADLLLDSISSDTETPELGGFNKRIEDSRKSLATANSVLYDVCVKEVKDARDTYKHIDEKYIEGFFVDAGMQDYCYFRVDTLGACVYDAMTYSPEGADKATIQKSATHYFSAVDNMRYGGSFSYSDTLFALSDKAKAIPMDMFRSNRVLFMRCLVDPDFTCRVLDPITNRARTMTQQELFLDFGIDLNGKRPTGNQYFDVLEQCPQLAGYFCVTTVNPRVVNGIVADKEARTGTLSGAIKTYIEKNSTVLAQNDNKFDPKADFTVARKGFNATEKFLLDQTWYPSYLVRCASKELEAAKGDPQKISNIMRRYHNKAVEAFYYISQKAPTGKVFEDSKRKFVDRINDRAEDELVAVVNSVLERAGLERIMLDEDSIQSEIFDNFVYSIDFDSYASTSSMIDLGNGRKITVVPPNSQIRREAVKEKILEAERDRLEQEYETQDEIRDLVAECSVLSQLASAREFDGFGYGQISSTDRKAFINAYCNEYNSRLDALYQDHKSDFYREVKKKAKNKKEQEEIVKEYKNAYREKISSGDNFTVSDRVASRVQDIVFEKSDTDDQAVFVKKMKAISDTLGIHFVEKDAIKLHESLFDKKTKKLKDREFEAVRRDYIERVFEAKISQINMLYLTDYNGHAVRQRNDMIDKLQEALRSTQRPDSEIPSLMESLRETGHVFSDSASIDEVYRAGHYNKELPIPSFSSKLGEITANHMALMMSAAGSPIEVSMNGGYTKKNSGFEWLSDNIHTDGIEPEVITVSELQERLADRDVPDMRYWWYSTDEVDSKSKKPIIRPVGTNRNKFKQLPPDTKIILYNAELNPHGVDARFTPMPPGGTKGKFFHRLGEIFGKITDLSQESMVIKAKKTLSTKTTITNTKYLTSSENGINADLSNTTNAKEKMKEALLTFRRDWAKSLDVEFRKGGRLADANFGTDAVRLITQCLTPGMEVIVRDSNGKTRSFMVDATNILGTQEKFDERWVKIQEAMAEGDKIISASVVVVPPEIVSMRINAAVVDSYYNNEDGDHNAAADKAMQDWNDYQLDSISAQEIYSGILPLGYAKRTSAITVSDSPTAFQSFEDQLYGTASHASGVHNSPYTKVGCKVKTGKKLEPFSNIGKILFGKSENNDINGENICVFKTFIPPYGGIDDSLHSFLNDEGIDAVRSEHIASHDNYFYTNEENKKGFGIVYDAKKIDEAFNWAIKTGNDLIVPLSVFNDDQYIRDTFFPYSMQLVGSKKAHSNSEGTPVDYLVIDVKRTERWKMTEGLYYTSSNHLYDPNNMTTLLIDDTGTFQLGDGPFAYTSSAHGIIVEQRETQTIPFNKIIDDKKVSALERTKEIVGDDEIAKIASSLKDENGSYTKDVNRWKEQGFDFSFYEGGTKNIEAIQERIIKFFEDTRAGMVKGGVRQRGTGELPCIALVKNARKVDGKPQPVIAPILLKANMSFIENVYIQKETNNDFTVSWNFKYELGTPNTEYEASKMAADIVAPDKGMLTPLNHNKYEEPRVLDIGKAPEYITSMETISSRLPGFEIPSMKERMMNFFFMHGVERRMSAIYQYDSNIKAYRYNDYITKQIQDDPNMKSFFDDLANNEASSWRQVELGNVKLFDPSTKLGNRRNKAIRVIAMHCRGRGINPMQVLSTYKPKENPKEVDFYQYVFDWPMIFKDWKPDQMETYFNMLDENFCPASFSEKVKDTHIFDHDGKRLVQLGNGHTEPVRCIVASGDHDQIGYQTAKETSGGKKKASMQMMYRKGQTFGISKRDTPAAIEYAEMLLRHPEHMDKAFESRVQEYTERPGYLTPGSSESVEFLNELKSDPAVSWREVSYRRYLNEVGNSYRHPRPVTRSGEKIEYPQHDPEIVQAMGDISSRSNGKIGYHFMAVTASFLDGYSWNDGKGKTTISITDIKRDFNTIRHNIKEHGLPIVVPKAGYDLDGDRYCLPLMTRDFADMWYENDPNIKAYWEQDGRGGYKGYIDALTAEHDKTEKAISEIRNNEGKRKSLTMASDWVRRQWGQQTQFIRLVGDHWLDEIYSRDDMYSALMRKDPSFDPDLFLEYCENQQLIMKREMDIYNKEGQRKRVPLSWTIGGENVSTSYDEKGGVMTLLNTMVDGSMAQSMANPVLGASNAAYRVTGNTGLDWFMRMEAALSGAFNTLTGRPELGSIKMLDRKIVDYAVDDPDFLKLFLLHRTAKLTGQEAKFLQQVEQADNIHEFLQNYEEFGKKGNGFLGFVNRTINMAFKVGSGWNIGLKGQAKNFLQRFFMFAQADETQSFWLDTADEDGHNLLEVRLASPGGAVKWYLEVFGANGAQTPSYSTAKKAMNSARAQDLAQASLPGLFYGDLVRKIPVARFICQTTFMKFPEYTFNITGKMLNFVMPMSSINYWAIERVKDTKWGEEHNVDLLHQHTGLKEAILSDIVHLGIWPVAAILATLTGALTEPPDKDKKGDPGEWLFFGQRIRDNWWVRDFLGPVLPMAEFWITVGQGEPRLDILANGFTDICSSNPLLAVPDLVDFFINPESPKNRKYTEEAKAYEKAPGGVPTEEEWNNMIWATGATSWVLQFITPSFARELYNKLDPHERSYKRVYKEGKEKNLLNTERVDFETAKWHQLTRNNPMLAIFLNVLPNDDTSYWRYRMPMTGYYDTDQLEAMQYWSVSGLSEEDSQAKCLEIITLLQSYEDMDQLQKTGFYMDTETRKAVSEMIWDIYHEYDEWYYGMQASGNLDNYVLGNGDWAAGNKIKGELTLAWKEGKKYWNDFYNTKIKYSYLSKPMQMYTRYNTTYRKDANGDVYATGYRNSGAAIFSPVLTAPGTVDSAFTKEDPQGTAGYENDWSSVSAVTGKPLGQRALSPVDIEVEEWPDLKEFGTNNGNGYSQSYNNLYGTGTAAGNSTLSTGKTISYGSSRGYSGGGYSGGGRSGGSSGYVPPIYSRVNMPNMPNPAVYRGNKKNNRPDLDYLRPSFETKGSRDAYRREDI